MKCDDLPTLFPDERIDRVNEDIRLIQKKQGLTFGTDAYLLAAFVRPKRNCKAVELGGGTGIVSLLLAAKQKIGSITAVEIQPPFAELIDRNARLNGFGDNVRALCADVRELSPQTFGGEVDLVVSNPPYMTCGTGKRNEADEKYLARHEVCGGIGDFCLAAARLLRFGGKFCCVYRPDRSADLFTALRDAKLEPKRMTIVYPDAETEPCMVLVEAVKGASAGLRVSAPLILHPDTGSGNGSRAMTAKAAQIYRDCLFPD